MSHALNIRRWRNDILVPRQGVDSEKVRAGLEELDQRLRDDLRADLLPWISGQGGEVVLIRSLVFECELDVSRAPDLLSARWARAFARSLIDTVEGGGPQVLRFASAAHYRAQFIADLAAGTAGGAWYYGAFAGLAALPAAAALRTMLLEDGALGRETLALLTLDNWRRLDGVLTRREAVRILEELAAADQSDQSPGLSGLTTLYRSCAQELASMPWHLGALYLYANALRLGLGGGVDVADFARLAARLPALAAGEGAGGLTRALRSLDFTALVRIDDGHDVETWRLLPEHASWGPLLADLLDGGARRAVPEEPADTRTTETAFAGLSLLLPLLDELLDDELCARLPPCGFAAPRAVAAWLTLARCAGAGRARQFVAETFWRGLFGIDPDAGRDALRQWLEDGDAGTAAQGLARSARQRARGALTAVPLRAAGGAILVDDASGLWCDTPGMAPVDKDSNDVPWRARLAAARAARADWRFLSLDWGLPDPWQRLFTHLAQVALRAFAWRIPGFAGASLPWLHANLLSGSGVLDSRGILKLQRPPLHVMLNLTGIGRGPVIWRGPPERVLRLEYTG